MRLSAMLTKRSVCVTQAQAEALHVAMPEVTTLTNALDRLDNFQQRAKECLR